MADATTVVSGLILIFVAGVCNGSWTASFSPKTNLCVCKSEPCTNSHGENITLPTPINDLTYHHAFALFQVYAAIINIPVCILWAGGSVRVAAILRETTPASIVLVIVFSVLWGTGTLLFGLACKIAGVGMGTNLSIGIVAVLGTLLPLIVEDTLLSPVGAVIFSGLVICCVGLWLSTRALANRDEDEHKITHQKKENEIKCFIKADMIVTEGKEKYDENVSYQKSSSQEQWKKEREEGKDDDESIFVDGPFAQTESDENDISTTTGGNTLECKKTLSASPLPQKEVDQVQYATWKKVGVCVATGVFSVQLQFAFIFGNRITDLALGNIVANSPLPGSTHESGGAAIIWLLAISLGAPVAILNGIYSSPVPLSSAIRTPLSRHLKVICCSSLPWVCHIHIYGVCATTLLPERVAAAIGWPLLMMVTTCQALVLSIYLGEWKVASDQTIRILIWSLGFMALGLVVLMCSAAVPT